MVVAQVEQGTAVVDVFGACTTHFGSQDAGGATGWGRRGNAVDELDDVSQMVWDGVHVIGKQRARVTVSPHLHFQQCLGVDNAPHTLQCVAPVVQGPDVAGPQPFLHPHDVSSCGRQSFASPGSVAVPHSVARRGRVRYLLSSSYSRSTLRGTTRLSTSPFIPQGRALTVAGEKLAVATQRRRVRGNGHIHGTDGLHRHHQHRHMNN